MDSIRTCSPAAQSSKTAQLSGTGDPGMSQTSVSSIKCTAGSWTCVLLFKKKSINNTPEMKQMLCIIFSSCFIKWNICFHQFHSIFLIRNLIRNGLKIERFITAYCHISTASFKGWIFSQWMITALHIIYFSGRNNQPNYSVKILSRKKRGKKPWI